MTARGQKVVDVMIARTNRISAACQPPAPVEKEPVVIVGSSMRAMRVSRFQVRWDRHQRH